MSEKIYFQNSKGDKLCGILSGPTPDTTVPVVILCHGFTDSKDNKAYLQLEQVFNKQNITTFRFDFLGHGESEGGFENITISEAVKEILGAIEYLKDKGFSKIGLVGNSFGGISSLMTASITNNLSVLGLTAPVSDYLEVEKGRRTAKELEEWKSKGFIVHKNSQGEEKRLNYSFFEDFKNNNGYEAAKKINIPTIIVHGDNDTTVPVEQSKKTASNIKDCQLEILPGADHNCTNPDDFEKKINLISEFIINYFCQ